MLYGVTFHYESRWAPAVMTKGPIPSNDRLPLWQRTVGAIDISSVKSFHSLVIFSSPRMKTKKLKIIWIPYWEKQQSQLMPLKTSGPEPSVNLLLWTVSWQTLHLEVWVTVLQMTHLTGLLEVVTGVAYWWGADPRKHSSSDGTPYVSVSPKNDPFAHVSTPRNDRKDHTGDGRIL